VPTVVEPTGAPAAADVDPEELAVPAELVPGALDAFGALPWPLGSFPELLRPPTLAGPTTPLTAAVPAPAEPALGAPDVALPDEAPPADPPLPPPLPPPPLCAKPGTGDSRTATISNLQDNEWDIGKTPFDPNAVENGAFQRVGTILRRLV
jgi:hypothetical protein